MLSLNGALGRAIKITSPYKKKKLNAAFLFGDNKVSNKS